MLVLTRQGKKAIWQSIVFCSVLLIICVILYSSVNAMSLQNFKDIGKSIATAGSLSIDTKVLSAIIRDDDTTPAFLEIKKHLKKIRDLHTSIRYVYIVKQTDKQGIASFWVDAEEDLELVSPFGEEYDTAQSPMMWEAFSGEALVEDSFTTDEWGVWLSSYAPVRNSEGHVIAVLGLDMDSRVITAKHRLLLLYTLLLYVVTCLGGVLLLNVSIFKLSNNVSSLSATLIQKEETITQQAKQDALTGLSLHTHLQEALNDSVISGQDCCLAIVDVDHLGAINEAHGHAVGDAVIKCVAQSLKNSLDARGVVSRTGGNEFSLLLHVAPSELDVWYESVRSSIEECIIDLGTPVYLSIGVGRYPLDARTLNEWVQCSRDALRRAKRAGGNRLVMARTIVHPIANTPAFGALLGLVSAVDNKDRYTLIHSEQVSALSKAVAQKMRLSENECEIIGVAGLLHDVGKIAVPDFVLRKPASLSPEERIMIEHHPVFGSRLIVDIPDSKEIAAIVLHHHERWDGRGYPYGLQGITIPLGARIMAVVDSYSAMTTDRPYRTALTHDEALAELQKGKGAQYHADVVDAFLSLYPGC